MAVVNVFNSFTKDLVEGKHSFGTHTFKILLTNTLPVVTNTVKANITEIAAGNGYSAGGPAVTIATSTASGVAKLIATDVTVTASGAVGPLRYAVIYNDSQATPAKPLVCWIDLGQTTMANLDTLVLDFDGTNGFFTV